MISSTSHDPDNQGARSESSPQQRDAMHTQACRHGEDDLIPSADWHFAGLSCNYVYNRRCCVRICQWVTSQRGGASLWCNPIFRHNVSNKTREPVPATLMAQNWRSFILSGPPYPHAPVQSLYINLYIYIYIYQFVAESLCSQSSVIFQLKTLNCCFRITKKEATRYDFAN